MAMQLKLDADGHAVIKDNHPVYVHDDGKEVTFDVPDMYARLHRDGKNVGELRQKLEAAEAKLKNFEGIEDPEAARKAIELTKNIEDGKLLSAGKVEEIKREARAAAEKQVADAAKASGTKIQELEGNFKKLSTEYDSEKISNAFAGSKFLREKAAVPIDMIQAMFASRFKREDGQLVCYDPSGNKMYSRSRPGELANFDEAMEMSFEAYPNRDQILKGANNSGSGSRSSNGNNGPAGKTMKMSEFNALPPEQQGALMSSKDKPALVD